MAEHFAADTESRLAMSTHQPYTFLKWQAPNFRAVNQFYRSQKHKGSASGDEQVYVIEDDSAIIGAVRLVPYDGYYWLRSLYIKKEIQSQGLGSQLLAFVDQHISQPIYCFPYPHLDYFYSKAGYHTVGVDQLPQSLAQLYERYNRKGQSTLVMAKGL